MKKEYIIIVSIFLIFIIIRAVLAPLLEVRRASSIVEEILVYWVKGDQISPMNHWENPKKYPHIYSLTKFQILDKEYRKTTSESIAIIYVLLDFDSGSIIPSGRVWDFKLKDTRFGWKVIDFRESKKIFEGINSTKAEGGYVPRFDFGFKEEDPKKTVPAKTSL